VKPRLRRDKSTKLDLFWEIIFLQEVELQIGYSEMTSKKIRPRGISFLIYDGDFD